MDPIFPYAGFSLYGVLVGMLLIEGVKPKSILTYLYGTGIIYFVIALILTNGSGFVNRNFQTPLFPSLILMLGPMLIFLGVCLQIMDFQNDERKKIWVKRTITLRTFGLLSLTLFMLEGSFSAIMRILFNLIIPGWSLNAVYLILFMFVVMIIWEIILKIWSRTNFKGSLEWLLILVMIKITGKTSTRMNFDGFLNNPDAYLEIRTDKK